MRLLNIIPVISIVAGLLAGCGNAGRVEIPKEVSDMDKMQVSEYDAKTTAFFAGGCFWGMEKFMDSVPGVSDVVSGYANGKEEFDTAPSYARVVKGDTGFKEAVRVTFDPDKVSYETLVKAYYIAIDPTVKNRQGNDEGTQYQTGVYYLNEAQQKTAEEVSEKVRDSVKVFAVELEPLKSFFDAEEYHQDYLEKNPDGYCHISNEEINEMLEMVKNQGVSQDDGQDGPERTYIKLSDEELRNRLTPMQYSVTQNSDTEPAFENEFWDFYEKGLYADVVTGEPLFISDHKYESSCGWPSFSESISDGIQFIVDKSHNMLRTEVRSQGDSHLGHIFKNDPESPNGTRYCINSASLKFIPFDELDAAGYGYVKDYFK